MVSRKSTRDEQEREELSVQAKDHVAAAADGLCVLVQRFDISLFSHESGLAVLVDALRRHLEKQTQSAEESELLLAAESHNARTIAPRRAAVSLDAHCRRQHRQPLWATLSSPEAHVTRPFRAGSRRTSPSELKRLCSTNSNGTTYSPGPGTPGSSLHSPLSDGRHVQGRGIHAARVLIADDCALVERLIWFAQARDLLKKNSERAPKPAQDSNAALETNQRQVQTLEEQLAGSDSLHLVADKLVVEERAAEQAETLRHS
ncbi:hypothetical protein V8E53_003104 [Lactarius tabidus]